VDVQRQHGLICKQAPSRIVRHNVMNDIIVRSLSSASIPASKEPTGVTGLTRLDGKRPRGKPVTWDITVVSTLPQSYLHASGHSAAGAAEFAASRKEAKYSCLLQSFLFVPIALETLGAIVFGVSQ